MTASILHEIAAYKRKWVAKKKQARSEASLANELVPSHTPEAFGTALAQAQQEKKTAVIAEIKKASPSKGIIREDFDPAWIAQEYAAGGASCLSVLTDEAYFQGSDDFLRQVKAVVSLPVIRKDFMIDCYQVLEARCLDADAILIIMAMVDDALARELALSARELGMSVLAEVHDATELERALQLPTKLIGINHRNLHDFSIDLDLTHTLIPQIPDDYTIVGESGIYTPNDIALLKQGGVHCFLVGESLMREESPKLALQNLIR